MRHVANSEQKTQRLENISAILGALRAQGALTRMELTQQLSLSWACISELTALMLADGLILEEKAEALGKGRTPLVLRLHTGKCFIGVDVNAMGLTACVCDLAGQKLMQSSHPIHSETEDELVRSVLAAIRATAQAEAADVLAIGLAVQGMRNRTARRRTFPGVCGEIQLDLATRVSEQLSLPVIEEHDPNCILLGFTQPGDALNRLMVRIDDGVGAALLTREGFFTQGPLELGYCRVSGDSLQSWVTRKGLEARAGRPLQALTADPTAQAHFDRAGEALGTALGNLSNLMYLDEIVLCGEMTTHLPRMRQALDEAYACTALPSQRAVIRSVPITDAAYGAAKLAAVRYPNL